MIKPNGYIILEGFSVKNLSYREKNPNVGEPADVNMLFTKEEMTTMFANFETLLLEQKENQLNEGLS